MRKKEILKGVVEDIQCYLDYLLLIAREEHYYSRSFDDYGYTYLVYPEQLLEKPIRVITKEKLPKSIDELKHDGATLVLDKDYLTYFPILLNLKDSQVVDRLKTNAEDIPEHRIIEIFFDSILKVIRERVENVERQNRENMIDKYDEIGVAVYDKKAKKTMFKYPIGFDLIGKPKVINPENKKGLIESVINYYGLDRFVELSKKYSIPYFDLRTNSNLFQYDLGDESTKELIQHYFGNIKLKDPDLFKRIIVYLNNFYIVPTIFENNVVYIYQDWNFDEEPIIDLYHGETDIEPYHSGDIVNLYYIDDIELVSNIYTDYISSYVEEIFYNADDEEELYLLLSQSQVCESNDEGYITSEIQLLNDSVDLYVKWKIKEIDVDKSKNPINTKTGIIVVDESGEPVHMKVEIKDMGIRSISENGLKIFLYVVE
ncbi:MAG TPA: hypothetical protein ENF81_01855 [Thermotogaceae bacterium]|nr:hypothetical protein [Thermotogaceae bacterium]